MYIMFASHSEKNGCDVCLNNVFMATKVKIIADINEHLQKSTKKYYSDFYIGITNDIERRLFAEHKVSRQYGWWIYREADSKTVAQAVEEYFLDKGMKGDTGGGDNRSFFVYCYEITNYTIE